MANNNKYGSVGKLVRSASIISIIFFGANFLAYRALLSAFAIQNVHERLWIGILFAVLSGGFILTLVLEKYSADIFTRTWYVVSAAWTGTFVYVLFAAIIFDISKLFLNRPQIFGQCLFVIAFGIGVYGIVHAKKIFIKKMQISIPNLPQAWKGRTVVWMSDLHLGSIYRTRFAKKFTRISNSLSPDVVFIGGDLYDGTHAPDPYKLAAPLSELTSKFGIFYITGNHEEFGSPKPFIDVVQKLGFTILNDEKKEIDGVQIVGVDYSNSSKRENFKNVLEKIQINKAMPSILLKHEPRDLDVAEQAGISFQISGHTHKGQQWPFGYLAKRMYKKYFYGLNQYEKSTMQVLVSSGVGGWGPPVRVGSDCEIIHVTFV